MTYRFLSPLPIDECAKRLAQYFDEHPLHFLSRRPLTLVGEMDGYQFTLHTTSHSNPNLFRGTLRPHPEGTLIEGDYHAHRASTSIWRGIVGCLVISMCVVSVTVAIGVIDMLAISDAHVHLGRDYYSILGMAIATGLFLPLSSIVLGLVLFLAAVTSQKLWESTDTPRIAAFMRERLQAQRVELDPSGRPMVPKNTTCTRYE